MIYFYTIALENKLKEQELLEHIILTVVDSDSDEEFKTRQGSKIGKCSNLDKNWALGHERIYSDYFSHIATYSSSDFRRKFRMHRPLFERIVQGVVQSNMYFT
jgi:hypothetical protein